MAGHETKKFWLIIDGKIVTDHRIEAYTFGKILTNLQKVVDVFQQTKYGEHPKTDFKLYLTNTGKGSVAVAFQPLDFTTELFKESLVFDEMVFDPRNSSTHLSKTLMNSARRSNVTLRTRRRLSGSLKVSGECSPRKTNSA